MKCFAALPVAVNVLSREEIPITILTQGDRRAKDHIVFEFRSYSVIKGLI